MSAGRVVARNFAALGTGEIAARLIAFAATVYVARTLGASSFGVIGFATAITLYLNRLTDGGVELGMGVREVAAAHHPLGSLVPSLLTVRLQVAAVTVVMVAVVSKLWLPEPEATVLTLYTLTLLAVGVSTRWVFLGWERAHLVSITRVGGEILMVVLVFALVRDTGDLARVPLAQFAGDALAALILLAVLWRRGVSLRPSINWDVVKPLARRGWPLVLGAWFGLMIYNADFIFLRVFHGSVAVGLYSAAYMLISFLINIGTAYSMSLLPTFTRLRVEPTEQLALYRTAIAHVFAAGFPLAVGGALFAPAIISMFFGAEYVASGRPLQILFWIIPVALLRDVPIVALMSGGREDRILRLTVWSAIISLTLNIALIPRYGMVGAAWATLATETIRMGFAFFFVRAEGFRMIPVGVVWKPILAASVMAALLLTLRPDHLAVGVLVGAATYATSLILLGGGPSVARPQHALH